jgi:hypothetical protein
MFLEYQEEEDLDYEYDEGISMDQQKLKMKSILIRAFVLESLIYSKDTEKPSFEM